MKKHILTILMFIFITIIFSNISQGWAAPTETLKAISFLPKTHINCVMVNEWVNRVNKEFKETLNIQYIGGPEVIPTKDQIDAVNNGVVDITFIAVGWYTPRVPVSNVLHLSKLMPWEERKPGGLYDFMVNAHKKINVMYLGRWLYGSYYLWINEPVSRVEDLKGKKMRTGGIYTPFMEKLGIAPVQTAIGDAYTALERGMISGFGQVLRGPREDGLTEKCKFIIGHGFYTVSTTILMDLKKWERMAPEVQKKLMDLTADWEHDMVAFNKETENKEWELLKADGVKRITFPQEEAKKYLDFAYSALWDYCAKSIKKEELNELKKLLGYQ
jgi:TRAP-type C4-dicarboxylate transport system substrate-binding protein